MPPAPLLLPQPTCARGTPARARALPCPSAKSGTATCFGQALPAFPKSPKQRGSRILPSLEQTFRMGQPEDPPELTCRILPLRCYARGPCFAGIYVHLPFTQTHGFGRIGAALGTHPRSRPRIPQRDRLPGTAPPAGPEPRLPPLSHRESWWLQPAPAPVSYTSPQLLPYVKATRGD